MLNLDIFCNVIDNYGDAGVCLHLARTLSQQGLHVRLWCDQLDTLNQILNQQDQNLEHLEIKNWQPLSNYECPDIIINAFNCRLDPITIQKIQERAQNQNLLQSTTQTLAPSQQQDPTQQQNTNLCSNLCQKPVVVINLDYLSAEDWIESCHGLTSFADGISCYYFFPGFTKKTGGLNVEPTFINKCRKNLQYLAEHKAPTTTQISLFSYHNNELKPLLAPLLEEGADSSTICKVFKGLSLDNLNHLLNLNLEPEQSYTQGQLIVKALPMLQQEEYDEILLNSTCNLVRGEDSIIRAMHTGHPFLWQIYKQEENAHIVKLEAFLNRMHSILKDEAQHIAALSSNLEDDFEYLKQCMLAYNAAAAYPDDFSLDRFIQRTNKLFFYFAQYLCQQTPLSVRMLAFIKDKLGYKPHE